MKKLLIQFEFVKVSLMRLLLLLLSRFLRKQISHVFMQLQRSDILDVMEEISYLRSDPFTIKDPILLVNSFLITCTDKHNIVEEGENCAYSIAMVHLEILFHILGYSLTLFGLKLEFQGLSIMLVTDIVTFDVKNRAPQASFKFTIEDLMSYFSDEFVDITFCETMDILEDISYCTAQAFSPHGPMAPLLS